MLFGQSKGLLDDPEASTVCRALTQPLDLPGRGYSSAPSPNLHPQSSAFFTNVLLYVLASSPLAWTGPSSFAAIGYSLGGGIVVNFVSSFCNLISSVILLAPSGLIRPYHFAWQSKFLYSNSLVPQWILECLVRQRLMRSNDPDQEQRDSAVGDQIPGAEGSGASTAAKRGFDVAKVVVSIFLNTCFWKGTFGDMAPSIVKPYDRSLFSKR